MFIAVLSGVTILVFLLLVVITFLQIRSEKVKILQIKSALAQDLERLQRLVSRVDSLESNQRNLSDKLDRTRGF
jgi:Tfp pilus assembly protein PilN